MERKNFDRVADFDFIVGIESDGGWPSGHRHGLELINSAVDQTGGMTRSSGSYSQYVSGDISRNFTRLGVSYTGLYLVKSKLVLYPVKHAAELISSSAALLQVALSDLDTLSVSQGYRVDSGAGEKSDVGESSAVLGADFLDCTHLIKVCGKGVDCVTYLELFSGVDLLGFASTHILWVAGFQR